MSHIDHKAVLSFLRDHLCEFINKLPSDDYNTLRAWHHKAADLIEAQQRRIEIISKAAPDPGTLRNMLRAMQNGEMTVSRGVELIDMWLAGNYSDDMLPPVREGLGEDEMPWDRIDALTKRIAALGAQEPVAWRHEYTSDLDSQTYHHSMMIDKNAEQLEYSMKAYNLKVVQSNSLFAAPVLPSVPEDATIEASFTYKMETKEHFPTILITLPPNHWKTRDRLADELRASAPSPQEDAP